MAQRRKMNLGGFSWKRLVGISAFKSGISRKIGIPLTKSGRERKIGKIVTGGNCIFPTVFIIIICFILLSIVIVYAL